MNKYIRWPNVVLLNGRCKSGKSYAIKQIIISSKENWDYIAIFSGTRSMTNDFKFLKSNNMRHHLFRASDFKEKMPKIMKIQERNNKKGIRRNVLLVFDDIFGTVKDSKALQQITSTFRHYRCSLIFSVQNIVGSATYFRELADYIFVFDQKTRYSKRAAFNNFFSDFVDTYEEFKKMFKGLEKYEFFFIDREEDKVFKMKIK